MKTTWRTIAATTVLALACLGLAGCTDTDDCDAASTIPGTGAGLVLRVSADTQVALIELAQEHGGSPDQRVLDALAGRAAKEGGV